MTHRSASTRTRRWPRFLGWLLAVGIVSAVLLYFVVAARIRSYLAGEGFRSLLASRIGETAKAQCELAPLNWTGWDVYSEGLQLRPVGAAGWAGLELQGVQGSLDWRAVRQGVWKVPGVSVDTLRIQTAAIPRAAAASGAGAGRKAATDEVAGDIDAAPGPAPWWSRWLPTRTEIGAVDVRRFDLQPGTPGTGLALEAVRVEARPAADEGAWLVTGRDGSLAIPGAGHPFQLGRVAARLDGRALVVHDASARWRGDSDIIVRGQLPWSGRGWEFSGRVNGLDLRQVLAPAWQEKASGVIEGDFSVAEGPGDSAAWKGDSRVRGAVVRTLPLLDRIAEFTHTERFRRVVLDEASGRWEWAGAVLRVTGLVLQSNGLLRVEGDLAIAGKELQGDLLLGVSPETLRWMPGAQNHVFTEPGSGRVPGFVWTRVHLGGTVESPTENLSSRLLAAMGRAVLIDTPMEVLGTGTEALGKAVEGGRNVLESGVAPVLEGGAGVIDGVGRGLDALKGAIPLIPK